MIFSAHATAALEAVGRGGSSVDTDLQTRILPTDTDPGILNRVIRKIAKKAPWPELRTYNDELSTTASQQHTDISTLDLLWPVSVRPVATGRTRACRFIRDTQEFDRRFPGNDGVENMPFYYALDYVATVHSIIWHPIPDAIYNLYIRYYKLPTNATLSTQSPAIVNRDDLIQKYLIAEIYGLIEEPQLSLEWEKLAVRCLDEHRDSLAQTPDWIPVHAGFSLVGGKFGTSGTGYLDPFISV